MIYSGTTSITWYAIDAAGNVDSCTYDIIVADGTGPVLEEPDTVVEINEGLVLNPENNTNQAVNWIDNICQKYLDSLLLLS